MPTYLISLSSIVMRQTHSDPIHKIRYFVRSTKYIQQHVMKLLLLQHPLPHVYLSALPAMLFAIHGSPVYSRSEINIAYRLNIA